MTVLKIKIKDNIELRNKLNRLYKQANQIQICKYAVELCLHTISIIDFNEDELKLINEGITINKAWQEEIVRIHDVRQIAFTINAYARSCNDNLKKIAFRVIGQAIASAHMQEHAMVASDYAIKLNNLINVNNMQLEVNKVRLIQITMFNKILIIKKI